MLVYEAVGKTLRQLGIETVFGLVGGGNYAMVDHMVRGCGIAYYGSRHEAGAVGMADGYDLASGRLDVATVTQGPGLTNMLTALAEAVKSRTPMLLLAGDTATGALHGNQDVGQAAVARSVRVGVQRTRGAKWVVDDVIRASRHAEAGRLRHRPEHVEHSLPPGLAVSMLSRNDTNSIPSSLSPFTRPMSSCRGRPKRSSFHTISSSGRNHPRGVVSR